MLAVRWLMSLLGLLAAIIVIIRVSKERDYPATWNLAQIATWAAFVGLVEIAHAFLFLADRDIAWLRAYSLGFGIWAAVAVPVACVIYAVRTREQRRMHRVP